MEAGDEVKAIYGTTSGVITGPAGDSYSLSLEVGHLLNIQLSGMTQDYDLLLRYNNQDVAWSEHGGSGTGEAIEYMCFYSSDRYRVVVKPYGGFNADPYQLTITDTQRQYGNPARWAAFIHGDDVASAKAWAYRLYETDPPMGVRLVHQRDILSASWDDLNLIIVAHDTIWTTTEAEWLAGFRKPMLLMGKGGLDFLSRTAAGVLSHAYQAGGGRLMNKPYTVYRYPYPLQKPEVYMLYPELQPVYAISGRKDIMPILSGAVGEYTVAKIGNMGYWGYPTPPVYPVGDELHASHWETYGLFVNFAWWLQR